MFSLSRVRAGVPVVNVVLISVLISLFVLVNGPAPAQASHDPEEPGEIYITKIHHGDAAGTFDFNVTGPALVPTTRPVADGETIAAEDSGQHGEYVIAEAIGPNDALVDIHCNAGPPDVVIDEANATVTINLQPGDVFSCTFTNRLEETQQPPPGEIAVTKIVEHPFANNPDFPGVDPSSDIFDFTFDGPGAGDPVPFGLAHGQSEELTADVAQQPYIITELPAPGYDLVDIHCSPQGGATIEVDLELRQVRIVKGTGDIKTCTFVNHPAEPVEPALLQVAKVAPEGDPGRFNLLIDDVVVAAGVGGATFGEGSPPVPVTPGPHVVSETAAEGTDLADYDASVVCFDLNAPPDAPPIVDLAGSTATVDVPEFASVVCLIFNTPRTGSLTVAVVGGDPTFALSPPVVPPFTVDVGDSQTIGDLPPGTYTLTMTDLEDGLVLDAIDCDPEETSFSLAARSVTFEIPPGGAITCTFVVSGDDDPYDTYDDDPGDPGFDFDTPFDGAGDPPPASTPPSSDVSGTSAGAAPQPEAAGDQPAVAGENATQPSPAAEAAPAALDELPRTGATVIHVTQLGGLLTGTGGLVVLAGRRRRRRARQA